MGLGILAAVVVNAPLCFGVYALQQMAQYPALMEELHRQAAVQPAVEEGSVGSLPSTQDGEAGTPQHAQHGPGPLYAQHGPGPLYVDHVMQFAVDEEGRGQGRLQGSLAESSSGSRNSAAKGEIHSADGGQGRS